MEEFAESAFFSLDSGTLTSILLNMSPEDVVQLCSLSIEMNTKCSKIFWDALFKRHFPDHDIPEKARQREIYSELAEEYSYYDMNPSGSYLGGLILGYKNVAKYESTTVSGWVNEQMLNTYLTIRGKRRLPGSQVWVIAESYELDNIYQNDFIAFDNYEDAVEVAINMATKQFDIRNEDLFYEYEPGEDVVEAITNPYDKKYAYIVWQLDEGQGHEESYFLQVMLLTLE